LDVELPEIIKEFVTEENIEKTIRKNLDSILGMNIIILTRSVKSIALP
jgi:hypothetical protein